MRIRCLQDCVPVSYTHLDVYKRQVRSILFVEKVEKEKEQDILVVYQQKDSLAKKENPVAVSLGEEGLKWLGEYDKMCIRDRDMMHL